MDAIEAMVASSFMGISTPEWAVVMLAKISNDRLLGNIQGLDKAFGFVGENNHTPGIKKRAYRQRDEMLMTDIFRLQLLNFSIDQACEMVAKKVLISRKWNQTCYELGFNATEPGSLKSTLRDKYYKEGWKRFFGQISEDILTSSLQHVGLEFLMQASKGSSLALRRTVPLPYTPQHENHYSSLCLLIDQFHQTPQTRRYQSPPGRESSSQATIAHTHSRSPPCPQSLPHSPSAPGVLVPVSHTPPYGQGCYLHPTVYAIKISSMARSPKISNAVLISETKEARGRRVPLTHSFAPLWNSNAAIPASAALALP